MSLNLLHSLELFTIAVPTPLLDFCDAVLFRFAYSERVYLAELATNVRSLIGDSMHLRDLNGAIVPDGGHEYKPILQSLFDALAFVGPHEKLKRAAERSPEFSWILRPCDQHSFAGRSIPISTQPPPHLQAGVIKILGSIRKPPNLDTLLAIRAVKTLGNELCTNIHMRIDWFQSLQAVLVETKPFLRVCWLKAIAGAWCTTVRMGEPLKWPCIFGCDARDEVKHYLNWPVLWQIALECLGGGEMSIFVGDRLCLKEPSVQKLRRLALTHYVYHACKFDPEIRILIDNFVVSGSGHPWLTVQEAAAGYVRSGLIPVK